MRTSLALAFASVLAALAPLQAQELSGLALRVVAHGSGEPIPGAQVRVLGQPRSGVSDVSGVVRIPAIPPGTHAITVERIGYSDERVVVEFAPGESAEGEVELNPVPVHLARIEARARGSAVLRARGFYDRQRRGVGTFVDREAVDARARVSSRISGLLERLPGLKVIATNGRGAMVTSHRPGAGCSYAQVYLDGMRMSGDPYIRNGRVRYTGVDVEGLISLPSVEAVEWYPGVAGAPAEFNNSGGADGGPTCGTLLIWTRAGR